MDASPLVRYREQVHSPTPIPTLSKMREAARFVFLETLRRLDLRTAMQRAIQINGSLVQVGPAAYDMRCFRSVLVVAVGKAAVPMTEAFLHLLEPALRPDGTLRGIVVGASLPAKPDSRILYRLGSHPLPSQSSLDVARLALDLLRDAGKDTLVYFLISGGASAMMELPLSDRISLADVVALYRSLVHSGLGIAEMNTLRKHVSAVKGGRLAVAAGDATQCTLLVSDVSPTQSEFAGSGPSLPDSSTLAQCRVLLASELAHTHLPERIREIFAEGTLPETPKGNDPAFRRSDLHVLLSSDDLWRTAQLVAQEQGFDTIVDLSCDEWDYREAASHLLNRMHGAPSGARPLCLISTGEVSVPVTGVPGTGGRNQQFALRCAQELADAHPGTTVLSAGSDGVDGNSFAAGGLADNTTAARALARGFSVEQALARFDAFPLLHALGDTVVTGPSGNNLRDLRLLFRFTGQ